MPGAGVSLTCQSSNNNISAPLARTVTLDLIFPPVDVSITSRSD